MIKINKPDRLNLKKDLIYSDILIFFICFLIGVVLGTSCVRIYGTESTAGSINGNAETWFGCFLYGAKYLALVFVLAFTAFGKVAIPSVFIINGYCLAKSVASSITLSEIQGFLTSAIHNGPKSAVLLPFLLLLSAEATTVSAMIFKLLFSKNKIIKNSHRKPIDFIVVFCISMATLLLFSFAEVGIASALDKAFSNSL